MMTEDQLQALDHDDLWYMYTSAVVNRQHSVTKCEYDIWSKRQVLYMDEIKRRQQHEGSSGNVV